MGGWLTAGGIVVLVAGAVGLGALPSLLGPDWIADGGMFGRPLRWEIEDQAVVQWSGRDLLLLAGYGVAYNGASLENDVHRLWLVDRATGEVLGRYTTWQELDPAAIKAGRLWVAEYNDAIQALTLPDLRLETSLEDVLGPDTLCPWEWVDKVIFPGDNDNVRILAKDGFMWDLSPDLVTLTRLDHDTPITTTPDMPQMSVQELTGEFEIAPGRYAILGRDSRRPALRVADQRQAVESVEVKTPLEGFLDGSFLATGYENLVTRPPEDVFIRHHGEDGGSFQLSRVSLRDGLRWTHGEADWAPGREEGAVTELRGVEDRGSQIFLWLQSTPKDHWSGDDQILVGVDPDTGAAKWVTRL